jgi:mannose-6-phosphate isomerase-like protein (cupin superfamily)
MFSPTAALFEGGARAGIDISVFVVHTPPGKFIEMHVHPYSETFVLLAGEGRWTVGEEVTELSPEALLVVPADTPHGLRNIGDVPLLVVSVHESGTLEQEFLGVEPS